jgi:uncharacterized integral membrane protein
MNEDEDLALTTIETSPPKRKLPSLRVIGVVVLGILAVILVFQNRDPVETHLLWATVEMPRAVLLLTTFLLGVIVGLLAAFMWKRQKDK